MSKDKRVLGKVGMALLLVFFYAPILFMIIFSFNSSKSLTKLELYVGVQKLADRLRMGN